MPHYLNTLGLGVSRYEVDDHLYAYPVAHNVWLQPFLYFHFPIRVDVVIRASLVSALSWLTSWSILCLSSTIVMTRLDKRFEVHLFLSRMVQNGYLK